MRGLTRQEASFDRAGVRRAYDEVAASYAQYFPGTEPEAPLELAMIDAFVAALSSDAAATPDDSARPRVLDAGCGAGRMSRLLADSGCAVEGVDLSPGMVDEARRARPDLSFEVHELVAEGDRVATRIVALGAPSGRGGWRSRARFSIEVAEAGPREVRVVLRTAWTLVGPAPEIARLRRRVAVCVAAPQRA